MAPFQSPLAEQESALEEVQVKVIDSLIFTVDAEVTKVSILACRGSVTSTETDETALVVPDAPEHVRVKV